MILLLLLPFYDRGPERRPERRPIATTAGIITIAAMAYLTYVGANAGSPTEILAKAPSDLHGPALTQFNAGKKVAAQSGCLACHKFGENGNDGPGPNLTKIAQRLPREALARTLENPTAPMPSFKDLPPEKFNALVDFLAQLK
jgi:ubiquinol-cytochrome c reductase cytochrome b subunit/menaquinol-cytochrome c reductase cytochrome b/c subunit